MISRFEIQSIVKSYGKDISIGTLGGHSALDVCRGAKDEGLKTVVVCEKGREKTYEKYYRSKNNKGIVDNVIKLGKFRDIATKEVQEKLKKLNTIFVHSRYFWVYCDFNEIENKFAVPIFGTRQLVRKEERDEDKNQYFLLEEAGIKTPKRFKTVKDIDRLVMVKVSEAERTYERAFFFAKNSQECIKKANQMIMQKKITKEAFESAVIEEFVVGAQINFNFFYSPLTKDPELLGTDMRRQTNIDGILRLTSKQQEDLMVYGSEYETPKYIETGHVAVTVKESLIEKAYNAADSFVKATQKHYSPGIIGPFALQGAITAPSSKEELVVFDVSLRIPGSPGTRYTPYMNYLYGRDISVGRRIAMEISLAAKENKLSQVIT